MLVEESVCIPYGTSEDPPDDITGFCVGGQLSVGDAKGDCPDVVRDYLMAISFCGSLPYLTSVSTPIFEIRAVKTSVS